MRPARIILLLVALVAMFLVLHEVGPVPHLAIPMIFVWGMLTFLPIPALQLRVVDSASGAPNLAATLNHAAFTLPGIAGIILTFGMAVDANVLIFERIREEIRAGKATLAAIDTGFSKAFLTIIDTHVATVVSCAFLFMFGTPAIRGFAVTLVIGLVANVFTSVFVSRALFQFAVARQGFNPRLSIGI